MVNGAPDSTVDSKALCEATSGGVWLDMYAIADAVKGVQVTDGDGQVANVQQRMVSYKDELGVLNSEYTVKVQTDVDGNSIVGGFGIATDSGTGTVQAGFDVDQFWVGKLGSKTFPFIIEGTETFIKEAVIQSLTFNKLRSADGSLMFTPAVYDGLGNVTEDGKLLVDYLDVDNLVATQAKSSNFVPGSAGWQLAADGSAELQDVTVRGHVEMDTGYIAEGISIGGIGSFAYKDSLFYREVTGTKPPTDADNTGSNTAANTNAVAGTAATTVRDNAAMGNSAKSVTNNWTRPGQTLIDGNKIFTGDAYVDTLQLKGEAITILQSQTGASGSSVDGTSTLHSYTINHGVDETIPMLISFGSIIRPGSGQAYGVNCTLGIQLNGSTVATVYGGESGLRSRSVKLNVGSGSNTLRLYFNTGLTIGGAASWKNSWLTSVGCKR
jgi:hypothetical protein